MSPFDGPVTIVPRSMITWLFNQLDPATVSIKASILEALKAEYTIKPDHVRERIHVHEDLIKRDLTRNLEAVVPDIAEELEISLNDIIGLDTENWKEITLYESIRKILTRATNRIFVGLPLCESPPPLLDLLPHVFICLHPQMNIINTRVDANVLGRDEEYLEAANIVTDLLGSSGNIIRKFPTFLHPVIAFFSTKSLRHQIRRCTKIMTPEIEGRKATLAHSHTDSDQRVKPSNDFLTWSIESALTSQASIEREPQILATRLAIVNFAANHSSTITATQAIVDLLSTDPTKGYIDLLRAECLRATVDSDGKWTKAAVGTLVYMDSAIRESQRMSSFDMHVGGRIITADHGLVLPDGTVLPKGSKVATPSHSIHFDEAIYSNPHTYDPLRFSGYPNKDLPPSLSEPSYGRDSSDPCRTRPTPIVNTSPEFLAFGHGKHACPGRLFAASVLKLLLATLMLNYDIKPFDARPSNIEIGETLLPDTKVKVLIRRRKT